MGLRCVVFAYVCVSLSKCSSSIISLNLHITTLANPEKIITINDQKFCQSDFQCTKHPAAIASCMIIAHINQPLSKLK
eukprot:UN34798